MKLQFSSRRGILGLNSDKNLKTCSVLFIVSSISGLYSHGFLKLEFSAATAESGRELGFFYIISLLPFKIALFSLLLHFILYINISFPYRNNN